MDGYAASLKYLDRSAEIAGAITRAHPDDRDAQKMFLSARLATLYNYRRVQRFDDAERTAQEIAAHAQALPERMHREDFFVDYDVSAAYKEIAAIKTSQGKLEEALAMNRRALAAVSGNMQEWLKVPTVKNHLAACYADTGLSEWRLQGYSDEASTLLHRGLAALDGCQELVCKSRAAELEGYAGLVDWSGGREQDGLLLMQRGVHDFDVLIGADNANDVFQTAARVLRGSYALALLESQRPEEALAVMRQFLKRGDLTADPRDLLIYGQILAVLRGEESAEPYLNAVLQELDREHQDGFEPQVMRWAATHAPAKSADRTHRYDEAIRLLRAEVNFAGQLHTDPGVARIFSAISAVAFARTVAAMPKVTPELRSEALRALNGCCNGLPTAYRVEQAGTIVKAPPAEEVARLKAELASPGLK